MPTAEVRRSRVEDQLVDWLLAVPATVQRLPVDGLLASQVSAELERLQARKAMDAAYEADLIMALAAERPDSDDPPPGHPGARRRGAGSPVPGTSEFLPDELAMVLNSSRSYASGVLTDAWVLTERMPAVHAARAAGDLDSWRALVFVEVLGAARDEVLAAVVPTVLPEAARLSSGKLRRRRIEAERRADMRTRPTLDGISVLTSEQPSPVAAAMWSAIDQVAQLARTAGDDRPIGLLRAEAHAAMVLRPGADAGHGFTAHVTVPAPLPALQPAAAAAWTPDSGPASTARRSPPRTCVNCWPRWVHWTCRLLPEESWLTRTTRPPGLRDRIEQRALPGPPPTPTEPPPF